MQLAQLTVFDFRMSCRIKHAQVAAIYCSRFNFDLVNNRTTACIIASAPWHLVVIKTRVAPSNFFELSPCFRTPFNKPDIHSTVFGLSMAFIEFLR